MIPDTPQGAISDAIKEVAKEAYGDVAGPAMKATGQLLGLVPRAINTALKNVYAWLEKEDLNTEDMNKILESKLQSIDPEKIVQPEPHVAVPAIQAMSYCMECEELREMHASLLAASLNRDEKDKVHPGFIEIIKNMSPLDARLFRELSENETNPVMEIRWEKGEAYSIILTHYYMMKETDATYESVSISLENLKRLGLINISYTEQYTDPSAYDALTQNPDYLKAKKEYEEKEPYLPEQDRRVITPVCGSIAVTPLGTLFKEICYK